MKDLLNKMQSWTSNNKNVITKAAAGITGAILGGLLAGFVADSMTQQEEEIPEWMLGGEEQDPDELEDEKA